MSILVLSVLLPLIAIFSLMTVYLFVMKYYDDMVQVDVDLTFPEYRAVTRLGIQSIRGSSQALGKAFTYELLKPYFEGVTFRHGLLNVGSNKIIRDQLDSFKNS
jgi:hypothetical protein